MKKIILLILIAIVPFLSIAQKRSKKNTKTEKISNSNATYEFMVIIGSEIKSSKPNKNEGKIAPMRIGMLPKITFNFDFGLLKNEENKGLMKSSVRFRTMGEAVNAAANLGWDFHSANVVDSKGSKVHYYYMKRDK